MTAPEVAVEMAFGSGYSTPAASRTWTDVTAYTSEGAEAGIDFGRQDAFSTADANGLSLLLNNTDGRFTPGNASSPYYPNVRVGVPVRVKSTPNGNMVPNPSFETNTTGWAASDGASIARVTTQFDHGIASCSVTGAGALAGANTTTGTGGFAVVAGQTYTAQIRAKAATVARNFSVSLLWYTAAGASAGVSTSSLVTDSTSAWTSNTVTATAPPTAAFAAVWARWVSAAAEVHWLDSVMVNTGSVALTFTTTPPTPVTRCLGYVDQWPMDWPGGSQDYAVCQLAARSRMARLGTDRQLKSIVEEEILLDAPSAYYTLGESEGATTAADSSGNSAPSLVQAGSGAAVTFGTATGPGTDGLTAATFAGGKYLTAPIAIDAAADVTVSCFFSTTVSTDPRVLVHLVGQAGSATGMGITINASGTLLGFVNRSSFDMSMTSAGSYDDGQTHHALLTCTATTASLYIDGVLVDSDTALADSVTSVGLYVGGISESGGLVGTVAHVAIATSTLSAPRVAAHADAGLTGFAGETPADRIERYASYAALPTAELNVDTGTSPMAHVDTTGQSVMDMLRLVEATEGGVLFDGQDGTLQFRDRASRYLAPVAVTLQGYQLDMGVQPTLDRTGMLNDATATTTDGTVTARALDQDSVDAYGRKNTELELATTDANEPHAAASWRVNTYAEPRTRIPTLRIALEPLTPTEQAAILALTVGSRIVVENWPSQLSSAFPDGFFVEGYSETIGPGYHAIVFNVSDAAAYLGAFVLDSGTRGLLDTNVLAY